MAAIRAMLSMRYGEWGSRLFRFLFIGSLLAYSAFTLMHRHAAWQWPLDGNPHGTSAPAGIETSVMPPKAGEGIFRPSYAEVKPARKPVPHHGRAYRALEARIRRREAELNRARMQYLRVRRQVALGRASERAAMKARTRVESALAALQEERDRLTSFPRMTSKSNP